MDTSIIDLRHKLDRQRTEVLGEVKQLRTECTDLRLRVQVLTQLLIQKQYLTVPEFSALIATAQADLQREVPMVSEEMV